MAQMCKTVVRLGCNIATLHFEGGCNFATAVFEDVATLQRGAPTVCWPPAWSSVAGREVRSVRQEVAAAAAASGGSGDDDHDYYY